jgi:hypothetical protein
MDTQVQQAKNNLQRKPDDGNLQRAVAQAEAKKQAAQTRVDQAKARQEVAKQSAAEAADARAQLDKLPQPALNDKNPAAQLAEAYASEAMEVAQELNRKAEELAKNADFGDELTPTPERLASATAQQEGVKNDVAQTAEDIARAARHERRLENTPAATALEEASQGIEQVANNQATQAQQQLETAAATAHAAQNTEGQPPADNQPALAANQAVAQSEEAIAQQAEALTGVLTPLQEAQAAAAEAALAGQQPSSRQPSGQQPSGQQPSGSPQANQSGVQQASFTEPSGASPASPGANSPPSFTPEEMATGRQLAQALDELDRLQAQPASATAAQDGQSPMQQALAQRPSLAQAAQAQQAQIAAARAQAQQQAALASDPMGFAEEGMPAYEGQAEPFVVQAINRDEDEEWGKLREQAADDLTKGRKEVVSEEYRKSVETYFRVLAERARRKQN